MLACMHNLPPEKEEKEKAKRGKGRKREKRKRKRRLFNRLFILVIREDYS